MSRLARFRNRRLRRGTGKYEVVEDGYDVRLPLHNDDIFQHGISFAVKLIGSMEVPRPSSRLEIITSMRKIRYEFKMKRMKKKRVHIYISQNGVKTSERAPTKRRSRFVRRTPKQQLQQANGPVLMEHTIFKVFYVSHDSQDLKIFSYIARDGPDNTFKCYVFKAKKRSQALNVVRTMGQAFEVVHKLQKQKETTTKDKESAIESEKTPAADPTTVTTAESPGGETPESPAGDTPESPDNMSLGSDKARTADEGLGGSETFAENEPVGSPIPTPFSISEPQATSSPEPSQALAQQNQTMQKMITMLRKQLESEMQSKAEVQKRNEALVKHNDELLVQIKQMKTELDGLKVGTISKIIGNTQHPGMPIFISTPGTPPTPPNNNENNVSILDLPIPPVEDTLIPVQTRQNWEIFDDKE